MAAQLVTYDPVNKELRTVVSSFANAVPISGRFTFPHDAPIEPGMEIGIWFFADGSQVPFVAPGGCKGPVVAVNERLDATQLDQIPSAWLLTLD